MSTALPDFRARPRSLGLVFGARALLTIVALVFVWVVLGGLTSHPEWIGYDAHAYWGYPRDPLYGDPGVSVAGIDLYRYSPAFVPLMTLFTLLPWPVFVAAWIGSLFLVYLWLVGPWWLPLFAFAPFLIELRMANVHLLLAAAIVLGFRWPAAWSFVLLTKVTPGVGLLWFAVRREWRSLAIALGATAAVTGVSFLLAPADWLAWFVSLASTAQDDPPFSVHVPLPARLLAAAAVVAWGARTNRRWAVVVAATISLPTLWVHGFAMLAGVVAVQRGLPEARSFAWLARWIPGRPRSGEGEGSSRLPVVQRLTETSVYEQVGGYDFFEALVDRFYEVVADDTVLLPLYPEAPDLVGARRRLTLFLAQYWGGPPTYSQERGHPRLRMRHFPFAIGERERDHWLAAMRAALDQEGGHLSPELRERLSGYFTMAADAMRNQPA